MSNIKKVLGLGMAILAVAFVFTLSAPSAEAAVCTMTTGTWNGTAGGVNDGATNGTSTFSGCTGSLTPAVGDTLLVPTNVVLTISASATVAGTTLADPVASSNGITLTGGTFTSGPLVFTGSSGAGDSTVSLASFALAATTIAIADGSGAGNSVLTATTGTITSSGGITFTVTQIADTQLTISGAGALTLSGTTGTLGAGGTVSLAAGSTTTFSGTGAQTINPYTYGILTLAKTGPSTATIASGTVTAAGATLVGATSVLAVSSGATAALAALTTTTTGTVTNAGTLTTSGVVTLGVGGGITNSGTMTLANVAASAGAIINTGTATITTFSGTLSGLTNTGTLNLAGATTSALNVTTLTAGTAGAVNYTGAAQTVFNPGVATDYYNLGLSGSLSKTIGAAIVIAHDTEIASGVTMTLTGASTSEFFISDNSNRASGTYGATGTAGITRTDNTYFVGTAGTLAVASQHSSSSTTTHSNSGGGGGSSSNDDDEDEEEETPASTTTTVSCPTGNLFRASDGAKCTTTSSASVTCAPGQMFSAVTGQACTSSSGNTVIIVNPPVGNFSYAFGTTLVRQGTTGEACKAWQNFLNVHRNAGLVIDGACGPLTMAVARAWQASVGLTADGALGPMSRVKANAQAVMSTN